jgi:hypothetical protein
VPVETLKATQVIAPHLSDSNIPVREIEPPISSTKGAGTTPSSDGPDAQNNLTKIGIPTDRRGPDTAELEKTAKEQKESLEAVAEK